MLMLSCLDVHLAINLPLPNEQCGTVSNLGGAKSEKIKLYQYIENLLCRISYLCWDEPRPAGNGSICHSGDDDYLFELFRCNHAYAAITSRIALSLPPVSGCAFFTARRYAALISA